MAEPTEKTKRDLPPVGGRPGGPMNLGREVVKPKNMRSTLLRIVRYAAAEGRSVLILFLLVLCSTGIGLVTPYLVGRAVDAVSGAPVGPGALPLLLAALALAYLCDASFGFGQAFIMAGLSQRVVNAIRASLFDKLQKLPLSFFDTHSHGELMSRVTNDIDNISTTISSSAAQLMQVVVTVVGTLILMLLLNPLLTLAALVTVPLVLLLARTVTKRTRPMFRKQQNVLGQMNGTIEECISGIAVVKAFGREQAVVDEFNRTNETFRAAAFRATVWSGFLMPLMAVINNLTYCSVSVTGALLVVGGSVTVGVVTSFMVYARQFGRPLTDVANIYNTLQTAVAGAERVFEILDQAEEPPDRPDAVSMEGVTGEVSFRHVSFGYAPGQTVLSDVSFDVPAGSRIAVVGPTGAGKTTVISLLARYYDVTGGSILIEGRDLRDYTLSSVRSSFGVVLQETYLFGGTVADNIRYGRPDASDEEVRAAARAAGADGFIRRLPHGYQTELSESGGILSGGEKQLVAIARAFLADAPMLILDEATSSVDTRTEVSIQRAMRALMKNRTTFIIAHRLSTIRDADRILVVVNGGIAESGTHDELMQKGGFYAAMYSSQLGSFARKG